MTGRKIQVREKWGQDEVTTYDEGSISAENNSIFFSGVCCVGPSVKIEQNKDPHFKILWV